MLAVASLKRSLEFDPVEQGVKRKRAEIKLSPNAFPVNNAAPSSPPKTQQSIFTKLSSNKKSSLPVSSTTTCDDTPMFTFSQTAQICTKFLREQDKLLREQYEQTLTKRLNEQYEQFVRYSHDSFYKDPSKHRLFHSGQQQETENMSTTSFSYIS